MLPIDWKESQNGLVPVDPHLYSMAMEYCGRELAAMPELRDYRKVWVSVKLGEDGKPLEATGIQALQHVIDLPISRYSDSKAAKLLSERVDSYCADNGLRGTSVFVYMNSKEQPEQRCNHADDWLRVWKAEPADRYVVKVR